MKQPLPNPSRWLRPARTVSRWAASLLLAALLLVAVAWGAIHAWIVPRIGDFRPRLEAIATRALGVPVAIGAITAHSAGWVPSFELRDVTLRDASGRAALLLPRVQATLSPRSLWHLGFEQLYIEGAQLDVRRAPDGRVFVAGIDFSQPQDGDGAAADWLFAQTEVVLKNGTVRWTDELRAAPPLALASVDIVIRNAPWRHALRVDATPPADWGDRFTLVGQFRHPLLSLHRGRWREWEGQLFGQFDRVDVSQLRRHVELGGIEIAQGRGALRLWADVDHGTVTGGTADLALAAVDARFDRALEPLVLQALVGRVAGHRLANGFDFSTRGLQFRAADGVVWPGGNLQINYTGSEGRVPAQGVLQADRLDLAALTQIARRVPLGAPVHAALASYAPQGVVETLAARWQGPIDAPERYQAKGRVVGLALASQPEAGHTGRPGLHGAALDFDVNQAGGKAQLALVRGGLDLPGVFEEPQLEFDRLAADLQWQHDASRTVIDVKKVSFANAHAEGEARLSWRTGTGAQRLPGVLDLTGSLSRADAAQVHRYLPEVLPASARHYVRDAILAGRARSASFRIRGDLDQLPFDNPAQGDFRIATQLEGVRYATVPSRLQAAGDAPWPVLEEVSGELLFERGSMRLRKTAARHTGLRFAGIEARIPRLAHAVVEVQADGRGPLADALGVVNGTPLARLTQQALARASATGPADYRLQLRLPIEDIDTSTVRGQVLLGGNDVRLGPDTPALQRARGTVQFSDTGFALQNVTARALGGELRLDGSQRSEGGTPVLQLRASGTATAEALRPLRELGALARVAQRASGQAAWTASYTARGGSTEFALASNLQGLALDLPSPFGKPADTAMPLRVELAPLRDAGAARDQLTVDLGRVASAQYVRDLVPGAAPRVRRGAIAVGLLPGEAAPLPDEGVVANIQLRDTDADTWSTLLDGGGAAGGGAEAAQAYLPTTLALRARSLALRGRTLHNVVAGGSREGSTWRANIAADELDGYVEYRDVPGAPRLYARLARLDVPASATRQVEAALLDGAQPGNLPALDIVVDDFELRDRKLGRLEVEATHRGDGASQREWRLAKLNLTTPEAAFTATGNWALLGAAGAVGPGQRRGERRTVMTFKLDIANAGDLLARFGMADVVRRGRGRMEGQVAWLGSPIAPDYPSMAGQLKLDIGQGQFLKADPGLAKLLGVLSLQSLPRRLTLDFRDVFSEGFAFDFVRGDVAIAQGVARTNNLQMKGVNAAVLMEGQADIARETQDLRAVVVPELNAGTASLVATAINPAIGLGTFLAQLFLRGPLIEAATQEFRVTGTWSDPQIAKQTRSRGRGTGSDTAPTPPTGTPP